MVTEQSCQCSNKSNESASSRSHYDTYIGDVIKYPEMVMALTVPAMDIISRHTIKPERGFFIL